MSKNTKGLTTETVVTGVMAIPVFCYVLMWVGYFLQSPGLVHASWIGAAVTLALGVVFTEFVVQTGIFENYGDEARP